MNSTRKSPGVVARAGKKEARMPSSYPAGPVRVKRLADAAMTCGICSYYREGRRKFCAFLGESVSPSDACRVDPAAREAMP